MTTFGILLLLAVAGGLGLVLMEALIRRPSLAAALLLGHATLEHVGLTADLTMGGLRVGDTDAICALLAAAGVARMVRTPKLTGPHYLLLGVVAVAGYSLVTGTATSGVASAVNESRGWVYFLGAAIYFSTVRPAPALLDRIGKYWVWAGAALAVVVVLRWASIAVGVSLPPLGGIFEWMPDGMRVIRASETLLIVQAFFIAALAGWKQFDLRYRQLAVGLLGISVFLQHRTIWAATAVALVAMFWRNPQVARRVGLVTVGAVLVGIVLAGAIMHTTTEQLSEHAANTQTLDWRVEGWRQLLATQGPTGGREALFGQPFGTGYERYVDGILRTERPHSFYLEAFLRFGAVGLLAIVTLFMALLRRLARAPSEFPGASFFSPEALFYLFLVQVVFGLTYTNELTSGLAVGLALGWGLGAVSSTAAHPPPAAPPGRRPVRLRGAPVG